MIWTIRHTGLVVRDIERSVAFYEALGFQVWKREIETGPFIECVVGISEVRLEWAKMRAHNNCLIELLQYHSHPEQKPLELAPSNQLGCSHVAFTVDDVLETCRLISESGGYVVNPPAKSPSGNVQVAYCYDPDGILMELVQEF